MYRCEVLFSEEVEVRSNIHWFPSCLFSFTGGRWKTAVVSSFNVFLHGWFYATGEVTFDATSGAEFYAESSLTFPELVALSGDELIGMRHHCSRGAPLGVRLLGTHKRAILAAIPASSKACAGQTTETST